MTAARVGSSIAGGAWLTVDSRSRRHRSAAAIHAEFVRMDGVGERPAADLDGDALATLVNPYRCITLDDLRTALGDDDPDPLAA